MRVTKFVGVTIAAVSAMTVLAGAEAQPGQAPPAAPARVIEITTTKLASNVYRLDGQGGTAGALTGSEGVLLVDSQSALAAPKIVAAIKQITDAPIRFLINTGVAAAHTGGNESFGKLGVTIFAPAVQRRRLAGGDYVGTSGVPEVPPTLPIGLPTVTYDTPFTFHMNGETVRVIPVPAAHTDSDSIVLFTNAGVLMVGDVYRSEGWPNVTANGGTVQGLVAGLDAVLKLAGATTKIVPGHGPNADRAAVLEHREMVVAIRDKIEPMVKRGMTLAQVTAAKPQQAYQSKVPSTAPDPNGDRFVGQVYAELNRK